MKHIGSALKHHIELNNIKKAEVAEMVGITPNYLSTIFKQDSLDAALLEKLCVACGMPIAEVFDLPASPSKHLSDIHARALLGSATVQISESDTYQKLLDEKDKVIAEKERLIQILLAQQPQR